MTENTDEPPLYRIAAFAIENSVDFIAFTAKRRTGGKRISLHETGIFSSSSHNQAAYHTFSETIPRPSNQGEKPSQVKYFESITKLMKKAILGLIEAHGRTDAAAWLQGIDALVISVPGVVEDGATLIQLPLWGWRTDPIITWKGKKGFNFPEEITAIMSECLGDDGKSTILKNLVYVINDATACSAYYNHEHQKISPNDKIDLLYMKVHDGINLGAMERGNYFHRPHPEYGHIYPNLHSLDINSDFKGSCDYHGRCLEGVVSMSSFVARARLAKIGKWPSIEWGRALEAIERGRPEGRSVESLFFDRIFAKGKNAINLPYGVDLVSHYISQPIHHILLSPVSPGKIIIGGRFSTQDVVDAVIEKISLMIKGYPAREIFKEDNLRNIIKLATAAGKIEGLPDKNRKLELLGASVIALARAQPNVVGLTAVS